MKAELLAPAGSYESMTAAYTAGADAVYIGGQRFGARAYADNPQDEQLKKAIDHAHIMGKKLYLTVNTLIKEKEMEELYHYLYPLYCQGLDAVIVQDLGVLSMIRQEFPKMDVHASTQMSITGRYGAQLLKEMGASRIVTARELSFREIQDIHDHVDIEIESFVHGALCFCYSGQCLMSSMLGGRSGNRGRCAQPCRLPYDLYDKMRQPLSAQAPYLLSPKDICTISILPEILQSGVYSLKIEGRMKSPEYTAGVTRIYRKYLDLYESGKTYQVSREDLSQLLDLYNRGGFSKGYYVQHNGADMMAADRPNHQGRGAARIISVQNKALQAKALEDLHKGDILEVLRKKEPGSITITEDIQKGARFSLPVFVSLSGGENQILFRTHNHQLSEELQKNCISQSSSKKICGKLMLSKKKHAILELVCENVLTTTYGVCPETAKSRPLTMEDVRRQMNKTGQSPFVFDYLEIQMEDDLFLPMQSLNELRRNALEDLEKAILKSYERQDTQGSTVYYSVGKEKGSHDSACLDPAWNPALTVSLEDLSLLEGVCAQQDVDRIYLDCNAFGVTETFAHEARWAADLCHRSQKTCFYMMPSIFREEARHYYENKEIWNVLQAFDGFLLRSIEEYGFLKEKNYQKQMATDAGLYTWNRQSKIFWHDLGIEFDTVPLELSRYEIDERGSMNSEMIVYGYLPLMVSAQCQIKNSQGCHKRPASLLLRDRKKKYFTVKNHCAFCYNTIYNSVVTNLIDCEKKIRSLKPQSLRLSFTSEDARMAKWIIKQYALVYKHGGHPAKISGEFTRGHFERGVE